MSKFKVGDRVRYMESSEIGTVVHIVSCVASFGHRVYCKWDNNGIESSVWEYQLTKEEKQMNTDTKVWIVGSYRTDGSISFSSSPYQHRTQESAKDEAERLARDNPGKKFVVFARDSAVVVGGTMWS